MDSWCFLLTHTYKAQYELTTPTYSPSAFFLDIHLGILGRNNILFLWMLAEVLRQFTSTQEIFWDRPIHARNILGTGMNSKWFNSLWFSLREVRYFLLNVIFLTAMQCAWLEDLRPGWKCSCPVNALVALFTHKKAWPFWIDPKRSHHHWGHNLKALGLLVSKALFGGRHH